MPRLLAIALLTASAGTLGAWQTQVISGPPSRAGMPQTPAPVPKGSGLILGQVVDASTGSPVSGAAVDFNGRVAAGATTANVSSRGGPVGPSGAPSTPSQRVLTDADGHFVFHDLPKGQYSFSVSMPGYLGGGYGQKSPTGMSRPLDLDDGERVGDLRLPVWKFATLSGVVVDEAGEPVIGANVRSMRRTISAGKVRLGFGNSAQTDDRGVFRIAGLVPGDYVIGIVSTQTTVPASTIEAYQQASSQGNGASQALSRALSESGAPFPGDTGIRVGNFILQQSGGMGRGLIAPAPSESGSLTIYQPLFYPSASTASQATPIRLRSGEERTGIDLQLHLVPALRVSGTVMAADGPAKNMGVHLVPGIGDDLSPETTETATTLTDATGAFTFLGVPAGQYTLTILKIPRPQPLAIAPVMALAGRAAMPPGTPPTPPAARPAPAPVEPTLWAQMPVSVADTDVTGLAVSLRSGLHVSGTVRFNGTTAAKPTPDQLQRLVVNLSPLDGRFNAQPQSQNRGTATGEFETAGYAPGKYFIGANLPAPGWSFRSALLGGRDVADTPFDLESDVAGVVLVFSDQQTQLSGTVHDVKSPTNVDASVVIFPADYQAWLANGMAGRRSRNLRTSKNGSFTMPSMPPGDYLIVAVTDEPDRDQQDAAYYTGLAGLATRISLSEGEKRVQDLTAVKAPSSGSPPSPAVTPSLPDVARATASDEVAPHGPFVADDQQPQTPVRDTLSRPNAGSAVLTGTVLTDEASARPLRRATVTLSASELRGQRVTITDDAGHFVFTALPPGRFSLSAAKAAYINAVYGQSKPGQPSTPLILTEGQRLDVSIKMARGAVITGVLLSPTGQPASNIQIQLLQYRMVSGERLLYQTGSNGNNSTDDRGVYRLYGLAPGEYLIAASSRSGLQLDAHQTTSADIQWAQQALRSTSTTGATSTLPPVPPPGPTVGYSAVFYPGTPEPSSAATITVRAGEERTGVDFPLILTPTSTIEGHVVGLDGQPAQNVQLSVFLKSLPASIRTSLTPTVTRYQPDGRFTASGLAPGEYTLTARTTSAVALGARGIGQPPGPSVTLWATTDVAVNGTNVSDVTLTLQRGMSIAGTVAFEAHTLQPPADLARVRLTLAVAQSQQGSLATGVPSIPAGANGAFTFENVLPGRYRVSANIAPEPGASTGRVGGPVAPGTPAGPIAPTWVLKSVILNGQDALDFPLEVRPGENLAGALVTFTDQSTELAGTLLNASGLPASEFSIIVFALDRTFWTPTSRRIRQSRPSADGKFRILGLPPGEYYMSAVTDFESGQVNDPAFLDQLVGASFKISLGPGEKKTQDLKLARTPHPHL